MNLPNASNQSQFRQCIPISFLLEDDTLTGAEKAHHLAPSWRNHTPDKRQ